MMRIEFRAAMLVLLSASFVSSPFAREPRRVVMDAREISIESPQLFAPTQAKAALMGPVLVLIAETPPAPPPYLAARGACERSASDLCFDPTDRRIVYRPVRQYMPTFDGLTAEGISLRRDAIRFKYSFK